MHNPDRSADFGGTMRGLREARGISLRDIAASTKVAVSSLEALERNDVDRLPGGIFLRAMVRSYAHEIGTDPESAVRDFLAAFPVEPAAAGLETGRYDSIASAGRGRGARKLALAAAAVVPLLAVLAWYWLSLG
jgi:cytoskeleton protein RodZ